MHYGTSRNSKFWIRAFNQRSAHAEASEITQLQAFPHAGRMQHNPATSLIPKESFIYLACNPLEIVPIIPAILIHSLISHHLQATAVRYAK